MIAQKLIELGFTDVTDHGTKNGKTLVRVMTSKGWAYERFASVEDAVVWARGHTP